jgi:hypothetical protein
VNLQSDRDPNCVPEKIVKRKRRVVRMLYLALFLAGTLLPWSAADNHRGHNSSRTKKSYRGGIGKLRRVDVVIGFASNLN